MKIKRTANVEIDAARLDVRNRWIDPGESLGAPWIRTVSDTETHSILSIFVDSPGETRLGDLVATLPPSTPANS